MPAKAKAKAKRECQRKGKQKTKPHAPQRRPPNPRPKAKQKTHPPQSANSCDETATSSTPRHSQAQPRVPTITPGLRAQNETRAYSPSETQSPNTRTQPQSSEPACPSARASTQTPPSAYRRQSEKSRPHPIANWPAPQSAH